MNDPRLTDACKELLSLMGPYKKQIIYFGKHSITVELLPINHTMRRDNELISPIIFIPIFIPVYEQSNSIDSTYHITIPSIPTEESK